MVWSRDHRPRNLCNRLWVGVGHRVTSLDNVMSHDRSQGVIAVFMHKMMKGLPITVFGNGRAVRDYVYIDDVTGALAAMVLRDLPVDTVNVGSGRGHTTLEVLEILSRVTGLRAIVEYAPARPHDVQSVVLDITRLRSLMAYEPKTLTDGVVLVWSSLGAPSA